MAKTTVSEKESTSYSQQHSQSQSASTSHSESKKVLDEAMLQTILAGLTGYMTDEEIDAYAENLLRPQRDAQLEAAAQAYEAARLAGEQEIEDLAAQLSAGIEAQHSSYMRSAADVQTAALARGMGRSSYTLETLANEGERLARAVQALTQESERKREQVRAQMAQQAQHSAKTQGRINTDYAAQLAAKVQELKQAQRKEYNQNYLTAAAGSMGTSTSSASSGTSQSQSTGTTHETSRTTSSSGTSSGRSGTAKKKSADQIDAVSSAAMSTSYKK